jgi:RNA polymerase sigma-70 factor (ECF subfamily)
LPAAVYLSQDVDDAGLVQRTLGGETAAFELLIARHQRGVFTVAHRMLGNSEDARDAVQTSLIKAYQHLSTFDTQQRFFSWLYRIVVNECLNMLRARRPEDALTPALAAVGGPFDAAVARERTTQVQAALGQLSPDYRAVIVLRHFGDLSYDEMSDALGVPVKTVKSRLHTARQRLGELLLGWRAS